MYRCDAMFCYYLKIDFIGLDIITSIVDFVMSVSDFEQFI